jgi:hypothetical protein
VIRLSGLMDDTKDMTSKGIQTYLMVIIKLSEVIYPCVMFAFYLSIHNHMLFFNPRQPTDSHFSKGTNNMIIVNYLVHIYTTIAFQLTVNNALLHQLSESVIFSAQFVVKQIFVLKLFDISLYIPVMM